MNLLIFSSEYDKAMAALILANTAREMQVEVTMFFTFWGLFLVRDPEKLSPEDKTAMKNLWGSYSQGPEQLPSPV